jgi:uncharacterized delta-60 repeat protein
MNPFRVSPRHASPRRIWRDLALLSAALCLCLTFLSPAAAGDGALDPSFDPGAGVKKIPVIRGKIDYNDTTGRSLIYGYFTSLDGVNRLSIARLNAGGGLDATFTVPLNSGEIRSVVLLDPTDSNSKILIAGSFSIGTGGNNYINLARLDSAGALDTTFGKVLGDYGAINAIALQSDGKIVVGGWSIPVAGDISATYHLLRLNANGTLDAAYPKREAAGGYVSAVNMLSGNRIRIFGTLPRSGGLHLDYLLLLSDTGATIFNLGDETVDGPIYDLGEQSNGQLLIAGQFQHVLGVARSRVARFNLDLTLDTSFIIGAGANGVVTQLSVQADDKIVLAGKFTSFNGVPCGYLVRLNSNGPVDSSFTGSAEDQVFRMTQGGDGSVMIYGAFRTVNGAARAGLAHLTVDGALTGAYAGLTNDSTTLGTVYALARQSDGKILIGGDFTGVQGKYRGGFARLNPDGTLDTAFKGGIDGSYVKNIAIQADGKILLAGYFGAAQSYACTSLARLSPDNSFDTTFKPIITRLDGSVSDLKQAKPLPNGQIMVVGHLRTANGVARTAMAKLNANGTLDASFDPQITITSGESVRVNRVAQVADKYVVSGYVTFEKLARGFLTRLTSTGAMDATFGPTAAPTPSPNVNITAGEVMDMALQKDGRIMVCGNFSEIIDGSFFSRPERGHIARFTADGFLDPTFTTNIGANNVIECMALQPNGRIIIGGNFTSYNQPNISDPPNRSRIARVLPNGDLDASFNPGAGLAEPSSPSYRVSTYALLRLSSGRAVLGGYFSLYNGAARNQLAQVFAGPADFCPGALLLLLGD